MAIQVTVSTRINNYKDEYKQIVPCEDIHSVVPSICSGLGKLSEKHDELLKLRHQINKLHEFLKLNFNRKEDPDRSPYQYSNKRIIADHFGDFYIMVERAVISGKTHEPTNDYCIVTTKIEQNTNWGSNLRNASSTVLGVASLDYFDFLRKKGAKIEIPDSLIYEGKIKGFWDFQVAGILLSAMSYEGYINYIGEHVFNDFNNSGWKDIQGKPEVLKKTQKISEHLKINIDERSRPYSSIIELFKLRNEFAHPKIDIQVGFEEKIISTPAEFKDIMPGVPKKTVSRLDEIKKRVENIVPIIEEDIETILLILWKASSFSKVDFKFQSQAKEQSSLIYGDEQSMSSYFDSFTSEVKLP